MDKTLRSISNPDKHCRLVIFRPQLPTSVSAYPSGQVGDFEFSQAGKKMYVNKENAFSAGFGEAGLPVIETLNRLIANVGQTIDSFKSEFG